MSEVKSVAALAMLYAFRMLGLFIVLPVLQLYGSEYSSSSSFSMPLLIGLALGIYGLFQAVFQIPLGWLSDKLGRKPVIVGGMLLFMLGSIVAATATSVEGLIVGRALQGMGAVASAIMAMVSDLTSEKNRTKAMAAIGGSIGLSFAIALITGPAIASYYNLSGVFYFSALLALMGVLILLFVVPNYERKDVANFDVLTVPEQFSHTLKNLTLMRLNLGIFTLHFVLMAGFLVLPKQLEVEGLLRDQHWQVYLPVLLGSFILMLPFMVLAEKKKQVKPVFLGAIVCLLLAFLIAGISSGNLFVLILSVFVFFFGFNLLEANLPSLVSKVASAGNKGTALGVYSTCQFLGAFLGGALGGAVWAYYGEVAVLMLCGVLICVWLSVAIFMPQPANLKNISVNIVNGVNTDALANLAGVKEFLLSEATNQAYLKVDKEIFDYEQLERLTRRQ